MTDTKLLEPTQEISTVDLEGQKATISSEKHKVVFFVGKLRSQLFFTIRTSKSSPPQELSGNYTSLEKAVEAVQTYIKNSKETFAVRSDRLHTERQLRKDAESNSKDGKQSK